MRSRTNIAREAVKSSLKHTYPLMVSRLNFTAIEQNRKEVGPSVVNFDRIELENKITTGPELLHFSEQIFWRTVGSEVLALK
ncbi:hypothetical protein Y032_0259g496 [Ancylostoma ceylanicum]|uniref:Uncharacterized protein n=1 Tax=Ancylostoma ceylanicum TaxID=53326 RepID=A0A016SAL0_9BILA|nr:hypothetical protein Y032_0259g496 [Ancylostoma ceylanicum]